VREAEAAFRYIQLRRRDPEIEQNAGQATLTEPWRCDRSEIFEAGVPDRESRVIPETLASVSHGVRVFVQSE
jgi:hypothetical protein